MNAKFLITANLAIGSFDGVKNINKLNNREIIDLRYHTSFDKLIPVCRKFDNLDIRNFSAEHLTTYQQLCDALDDAAALYKIEPLHDALAKCIEWYSMNTINGEPIAPKVLYNLIEDRFITKSSDIVSELKFDILFQNGYIRIYHANGHCIDLNRLNDEYTYTSETFEGFKPITIQEFYLLIKQHL